MNVVQKGRKLEVNGVLLAKLSPNDRAEIAEEMKADLRKTMLENLDRAKITGEAYFAEIDAFDQEAWGETRWIGVQANKETSDPSFDGILDSYKGQAKIIDRGGRKEHGDKWPEIYAEMDLSHSETWGLAAMLSGIQLRKVEPVKTTETGEVPQRPSEAAA